MSGIAKNTAGELPRPWPSVTWVVSGKGIKEGPIWAFLPHHETTLLFYQSTVPYASATRPTRRFPGPVAGPGTSVRHPPAGRIPGAPAPRGAAPRGGARGAPAPHPVPVPRDVRVPQGVALLPDGHDRCDAARNHDPCDRRAAPCGPRRRDPRGPHGLHGFRGLHEIGRA